MIDLKHPADQTDVLNHLKAKPRAPPCCYHQHWTTLHVVSLWWGFCSQPSRSVSPAALMYSCLYVLTPFLGFSVRYSVFQNQSPVGFEHWFSVLSAEQSADLLLEHDAPLRGHRSVKVLPSLCLSSTGAAASPRKYFETLRMKKQKKSSQCLSRCFITSPSLAARRHVLP